MHSMSHDVPGRVSGPGLAPLRRTRLPHTHAAGQRVVRSASMEGVLIGVRAFWDSGVRRDVFARSAARPFSCNGEKSDLVYLIATMPGRHRR